MALGILLNGGSKQSCLTGSAAGLADRGSTSSETHHENESIRVHVGVHRRAGKTWSLFKGLSKVSASGFIHQTSKGKRPSENLNFSKPPFISGAACPKPATLDPVPLPGRAPCMAQVIWGVESWPLQTVKAS